MSVIAFDVSKKRTGWAYRSNGRWVTGIVDVLDSQALRAVIADAIESGVEFAVIEDCYLDQNPATLKALQDAQTRVAVACDAAGLASVTYYAQEWQCDLGIEGKRSERKAGAQRVAQWLGAGEVSQDEADAVCMADYAERVRRGVGIDQKCGE